ncbi:MAG: PAS domain S-box protein, partial [Methanoregula sp.]
AKPQFAELAHKIHQAVQRHKAVDELREKNYELQASYEQLAAAEEELRQQYDKLKKDEEIIRESEIRFHDLTEMLPQMVFEADVTGKYTYINRMGKQMTQLTDEDIQKGYIIRNHIYPEDLPRLLREFQEISADHARTGGPAEYRAVRKDGVIVPITAYTIPIVRDDKIKGFRGIVIDMTEKKKTEAAEILAKRKLVIMNDVSRHIIRNKMAGLIGCAEMISEISSKNERHAISKEIKDLIYSIKKQIDFTQEYEKVGMTLPVWKNLKQIISSIDTQGIPVVLEFKDYDIFADPLLENLFNYFIENSLKNGETVTEIRFSSQERPDGLVLTYADNGVGIHPSQKLKIFEHHADPRQGVGLLLVREILAITDITITETGVFGEGARFEMLVPPGKFRHNP